VACLAALLLATAALATDRLNPVDGARRLRQLAGRLAPLPDTASGITRDVGSIAIIEHDGSDYDAFEDDGVTPNYAARAAVAQRFYQTHGDFYDFLVVFTNFEFETKEATAFHNLIRNDVRGIGLPIVDNGPAFGSPGRLKGYVDMAAVSRYTRAPLSLDAADPGFTRTLNILAHETAHQWLTEARFRDSAGQLSSDLLKGDGHWSYLLDSDASVMYGADWVARGDGRYAAARVQDTYFSLDLYLMGLLDPAKVTPFNVLRNPAVSRNGIPLEDAVVEAVPETVTIDQVLAAEGPRSPGFEAASKAFRLGFIFLTQPGTEPSAEELEAVERVRRFFVGHFFAHTRGIAIADTTLAEAPTGPSAGAPDLDKALAWLLAQQLPDGRWQDSPATAIRDTVEALAALLQTGHQAEAPYQHGRGWASAIAPANLDFAARRAMALAPALDAAARSSAMAALLAQQNADGGFGAARGYESDAFDTALALRALSALGNPADARVRRGLQALASLRSPSGGWPIVPGGEVSTLVTAHALLAAQDWSATPEAPALIAAGLGPLLARQNADHGFGESPSTPYATALALQVLLRSPSAPASAVEGAIAWLQASQLTDGSWGNSRFETSLVLGTLQGSVSANLVVPADGLVLSPAAPQEGETVQVTARVRNVGRSAAGGSHVRLVDGDPRTGESIAETAVPPLAPGEEATVSFEYSTADRAGDRTLYVVADSSGDIAEAREDDNATSRAIHVEGMLPDLVIGPGDVNVDPYPPEEGETAEISVRVSNQGRKAAVSSRLLVTDGSPRQGGRLLGQATIPPLSVGESIVLVLPWNTTGAGGDHVLYAIANADFTVRESDPDNNQQAVPVTVTPPLPPGPDLSVVSVNLTPSSLTRFPESIGVEVLVRNLGRDAAASTLVLYDADPPTSPLTRWTVNVAPRSSARYAVTVSVTGAGDRTFTAVADPDGTLAERDENNNRASALLRDPHNTFDLEVLGADLTPSATDLVIGEALSVTAIVRNRGTAAATQVPVMLGHDTDSGLAELTRALVTLAPGTAAPVTLTWTTSMTGDPVPLAVRVDPFDLLLELSESNNTASLPIRIRPSALSNLAVSGGDVAIQPDPPREGAAATVSAVVRNTSPVAAGLFAVRFHRGDPDAGGVLIAESTLPGLAPLTATTVTVNWSPVDVHGAQGLFVVADALGQVDEYDESDNIGFRPFSVLGLPDLVLTAGDVTLEPRYPRAGEPVTVHATVRNLGGLPAEASVLHAAERAGGGTIIGNVPIPPLAPGADAAIDLQWTPASPAGERTLTLVADAGGEVREQDEGNNQARRSVVVQNADLFLTEAYFSPDGDGIRDDTSLAYRATGSVTVVVSNERGQRVRTLAKSAAPSGVVPWDGRDDHGRLLEDGAYTLTVFGEAGAILGRATAIADTNRRSIYDAAGTGLIATSNLSCALPDGMRGPVFMPSEDVALFLIKVASEGFPLGLVRVSLGGSYEYVAQDPWYAEASFPVPAPDHHTRSVPAEVISPDGRELLLASDGDLYAVDLLSGARRLVRAGLRFGRWSPDGRFITGQNLVLAHDGAVVGELPDYFDIFGNGWVWSPDSQFLAAGNRIVRRDGTGARTIPKPMRSDSETALDTVWRRDGKIFAHFGVCGDGCGGLSAWALDPETDTATELAWLTQIDVQGWSPDGSKVLYTAPNSVATVAREDGSSPLRLLPFEVAVAPRGATAAYWDQRSAAQGATCNGPRTSDVFAATSLQNLTADFFPTRLPGNNGILVRGTVSDRHLDHYQLEYARQDDPAVWHPLGPASEIPVLDDVLAVWVPPAPGSYLVRLRAEDRAGNTRSRTRVVAWDRFPVIANLTQDEFLISPNGDDTKDSVTFNYLVMEPTGVEVRVVGPLRTGTEAPPPPTVTTFSVEHPTIGPGSFGWDGRDGSGAVLPDGRYTVFVNDLPLRVELDATPPDIAFALGDLRTDLVREPLDTCGSDLIPQGVVTAERRWHVVDDHLKGWLLGHYGGNDPIYEPEKDESGQIVYDEDGVPRVSRVNGRAVDHRDRFGVIGARDPETQFTAEDYAGNRSTVAVLPVDESLRILDARAQPCALEASLLPPIAPEKPVHALTVSTFFTLAETIQGDEEGLIVRFQYQPLEGGAWADAPPFTGGRGFLTWEVNFIQLGLQLGTEYRGRFVTESRGRTFTSEEFFFRPCDDYLALQLGSEKPVPSSELVDYTVQLVSAVDEPLARVTLTVLTFDPEGQPAGFQTTVTMDRVDSATFRKIVRAPRASCEGVRLGFSARVFGESGREYKDDKTCARLGLVVPLSCPCRVAVRQQFGFCDASPSAVGLRYSADSVFADASLRIERGPEDAPLVMAQLPMGLERDAFLDATGLAEGLLPLRARIVVPGDPERACASVKLDALVDRTPSSLAVLEPVEGAQICGTPDPVTGHEVARLTVQPSDFGREVALEAAEFRVGQSAWRSFVPSCPGTAPGSPCPQNLPTGALSLRGWDITGLPEGDLAVRLKVCDQAGNKTAVVRNVSIGREPPVLALVATSPPIFSPNGDGRNDETTITVRTQQTLRLTVEVRQATDLGAVVRTLAADQQFLPGELPFAWDGRTTEGDGVPDGRYVVFVVAADPCGRGASLPAGVLVDNTPPTAVITRPVAGEGVRVSVDVRGAAADAHFLSYELAYGLGPAPQTWTLVGTGSSEVSRLDGLLGRWDPPSAEGAYTLRLRALDVAGNEASAYVTVDVGRRIYVDRLVASPSVFSPNNDGKRETTTIEYGIVVPGRVSLQVRGGDGTVLRTLESGNVHDAGMQAFVWDGHTDGGQPAPEGELLAWVRVEDPAGTAAPQEEAVSLVLDRTPPLINLERPPPESFVARSSAVHGSISDLRLAGYSVQATPPGGAPVELARGAQARSSEDLASLAGLTDGSYVLAVTAEDTAENRARAEVAITIDSVPPNVAFEAPVGGAVLLKGATPIEVIGRVSDEHLEAWTLRFGPGPDPTALTEIARSVTGGSSIRLAAWGVASLPDGTYTLVLEATDRAGQHGQARLTLVLDGRQPDAQIAAPADGAAINREIGITGTARDANLESWQLESAPGTSATAFQWSPVAAGNAEVAAGTLATWSPLPPDGLHTLRLVVRDKAGLSATAVATVTIDTVPPAAPTGLAAEAVRTGDPTADVRLTWNANGESDLAGYRVSRDGVELTPDLLSEPRHVDAGRPEGVHHYSVIAVDRAGNVSLPAQITVRLDLSPPVVDIQRPAANASLSGSVDVRGTAYSVEDFKEYRLLVGAGTSPSSWTLLRRSTVPVAAALLGNWTAVGDGPYLLAVEAEDVSGNLARVTRAVFVDNQPPAPPVLTSVVVAPDPESLTSTWTPSPSSDAAGYLVYRNGHIANAAGIVTGSLLGYRLPGPTYVDPGLPDGRHCYRIITMDGTENLSPPSNEICQDLDKRAPQATILQPTHGTRFQYPIRIVAGSADLDLASVQFQIKASDAPAWQDLGAADTAEPYETTLDPAGSSFGDYELRAVATDRGGRFDPDPTAITVTYGDTTAPPSPPDLVARVDGYDVQLVWSPVSAPDLEGYQVYRDQQLIAHVPASEPTVFADLGVAPGPHQYAVAATDQDGNESAPSDADALVYALSLDFVFPITTQATVTLSGRGSHDGTTVQILRQDAVIAETPGTGETFAVPGVPLAAGGNVLVARAHDANGNRSIPSTEALLIRNEPPAAVTGLISIVEGHDVRLAWNAVGNADLFGYVVRRGTQVLTGSSLQTDASIAASDTYPGFTAEAAFDGNPFTAWLPSPGALPAVWSADFAGPILVDRVTIRFLRFGSDQVVSYRVEARWEDRFVPLFRQTATPFDLVDHPLPAPFATDGLRVVLEEGRFVGIAEVTVSKRDLVPAGTTTFTEAGVADGFQRYEVAAMDRYGAEGALADVKATVGDIVAPAAPTGLTAVVDGRDVVLSWNANSEHDLAHYVLLREGVRIATTAATTYRDPGLHNGDYRYTVLAVDAVGNESPESEPAFAAIDAPPIPPGAPAILFPTDAAHAITLEATHTDVRGRADPGALVSLELNGALAAITAAEAGFVELRRVAAPTLSVESADVSPDGRTLAFAISDEETERSFIRVIDVASGLTQDIDDPTYQGVRAPSFSPDGQRLALLAFRFGGGSTQHLLSVDLDTGARTEIEGGSQWIGAAAWSPDGNRIAFVRLADGGTSLQVRDLASGTTTLLATTDNPLYFLRWSPDATRIAAQTYAANVGGFELRIFDTASGAMAVVPDQVALTQIGWSPDSRRLAYTSAAAPHLRVAIYDLDNGTVSPVTAESSDAFDPRFDRENAWLSFSRVEVSDQDQGAETLVARRIDTGEERRLGRSEQGVAFRLHEWVDGNQLAGLIGSDVRFLTPAEGFFDVKDIHLAPGDNVLVARATDPLTGVTGADSEAVHVTVAPSQFADLAVTAADLTSYPTVPVVGQSVRLATAVRNHGSAQAERVGVTLRLLSPGGTVAFEMAATVSEIAPGATATVSGFWTPTAAGTYLLHAVADPAGAIVETVEDNNEASAAVWVVASGGLAATVDSDRAAYPAHAAALVRVKVANGGAPFDGMLRTTVEDSAGQEVALLDARDATLAFGRTVELSLPWNTDTTYAGTYAFRVRAMDAGGAVRATAGRSFSVLPDISLTARLVPERAIVGTGDPVRFDARVQNRGANAPLESLVGWLRILPEGSPQSIFQTEVPLPRLLPGAVWETRLTWPSAAPAGRYIAELQVLHSGSALAIAQAPLTVSPAEEDALSGTIALDKPAILAGAGFSAQIAITNRGPSALSGLPIRVDLLFGAGATVVATAGLTVDLGAGAQHTATLPFISTGIAPGTYPVFLRAGDPALTLDRATLRVHGTITAPSIDSPSDGSRVSTSHPALTVNNASSTEGATLRYEFHLFADATLTQPLPGAAGIAEGSGRTAWSVAVNLVEDRTYYWRARATDGFSTSPWTPAAAFTVDARNEPPSAPVPDTPFAEAHVASREPILTVSNAHDPELDPLTYEFRLGIDPVLSTVVASATGVSSGPGLTSWAVPLTLEESTTYYWSVRATDGHGFSPWSVPIFFVVDTLNDSPSAPTPIAPVGGVDVPSLTPELVVGNASDPENDALTYRFAVDTAPSFDSPALQVSPPVVGVSSQTTWTPAALADNTLCYWRASASDGNTSGPWAGGTFFVNLANDPPGAPILVDPVDGRTVTTATPTLRLTNTTDADQDALTYEFEVRDAAGSVVATAAGVAEGAGETPWTVPVDLAEDASFTWAARAHDGEANGGWSAPASFRVDVVPSPPTAPTLVAPAERSAVDVPRPALVVANATSPEGLPLSYRFELYAVDGTLTLVAQSPDLPEGMLTTSWTPPFDLADGGYAWRARAADSQQAGPWMNTAHFTVLVDVPPAAPSGLRATPGDHRVTLAWNASPEPDVTGYRVYRAATAGGPYELVGATPTPSFLDAGLPNDFTVRYVVTAVDAQFESVYSAEVAATPTAPPPAVIPAEIRFTPATIDGVCLVAEVDDDRRDPHRPGASLLPNHADDDDDDDDEEDDCPRWIYATIELPAGVDPAAIEQSTVRLAGSIRPDAGYGSLVDEDRDGLRELKLRFAFHDVRERLTVGSNVLRITGRVAGTEFRGDGTVLVTALEADLWFTPRTLNRKSQGDPVQARLTFHADATACDVSLNSLRLNDAVPVQRKVSCEGRRITVKFDRAAVIAVLPVGDHVEVRVTGTIHGLAFTARDFIRVIP
jgi:subtilase family serine protease/fibronectin type 3 domain-containing protein